MAQDFEMESFEALLAEYEQGQPSVVREGEIVSGKVVDFVGDYVVVDIGYKSEGQVAKDEFKAPDGSFNVKIGDTVDVYVEATENENGLCVLSKKEADKLMIWEEISQIAERDETVEGTIMSRVKGGLAVDIGVRAFLPGSQVELRPTRNLDKFIGQKYRFKIIKFNKKRGNIVLSRRALLEKERAVLKEQTLERLHEGAILDGIVKNITEYGAFVDLGGIDGLLHITDMSWGRIKHPSEMLKVGQELDVYVKSVYPESKRISLSVKDTMRDPWYDSAEKYSEGQIIEGKVIKLTDFGAFMEIEPGFDGLIPMGELADKRIERADEAVHVGDIVRVKILRIDTKRKRISLSITKARD